MSVLNEYINKNYSSSNNKLLPSMHSCEGYACVQIMRDNMLMVQPCPIFKEDLLYFFYGKPAYPAGAKANINTSSPEYHPVCFIVDSNKIKPKRVFPFDSGAFHSNNSRGERRYSQYIHPRISIENYDIYGGYSGILKYISVIYRTNERYLNGEVLNLKKSNIIEIDSLFRLLRTESAFEMDERAYTIEIISNESFVLSDIVEYVILPNSLIKEKSVTKWLSTNNIEYETYRVRKLCDPGKYYEAIVQAAFNYLIRKGLIDETEL